MCDENKNELNYKKIYNENYKYVRNILKKSININDLDDATQEVFFRIYKGLNNFKGKSKIQTWIYKISENVAIDYRKIYIKENKQNINIDQQKLYKSYNFTKHIFDKIKYNQLITYIDKLKPKDRIILKMKDLNHYNYKKISNLLSLPIGTVKSRVFYARRKVKNMIDEDYKG